LGVRSSIGAEVTSLGGAEVEAEMLAEMGRRVGDLMLSLTAWKVRALRAEGILADIAEVDSKPDAEVIPLRLVKQEEESDAPE
jgi:hypothetical protein